MYSRGYLEDTPLHGMLDRANSPHQGHAEEQENREDLSIHLGCSYDIHQEGPRRAAPKLRKPVLLHYMIG